MRLSQYFLIFTMLATATANACGGNAEPDDVTDILPDGIDQDVAGDSFTPQEFDIRTPNQEFLECQSIGDSYFIGQIDYVCRIDNDELVADLYIQSSPTDCGQWGNPTYVADNAWLKIDGVITATTGGYEFGGRHHNDMLTFMHDGASHMLWHSSIGYGWRACATPDCLVICNPGVECAVDSTEGVAIDGCLRDAGDPQPPLRAICVEVTPDGTVPAFDDPWTTLDPYAGDGKMILPCRGEESMEI